MVDWPKQKQGAVVILNLKAFDINVLFPTDYSYQRHSYQRHTYQRHSHQLDTSMTDSPFSDRLMKQLTQLGEFLMANGRTHPSIVAAGYWLRKSHLLSIKAKYPINELQAKGTVFHIAPGNVDTLFFYSMMVSMLCGNQTILRVSHEMSVEAKALLLLLNQFHIASAIDDPILSLLTVIQYPRDDVITAKISSLCHSRVIWGGDQSIAHISQFPLLNQTVNNKIASNKTKNNQTTNNICFPDRYSVAVIQIEEASQLKQAVDNLLRDIKPYHQQACSSPRVVYWLNTAQSLQDKFWTLLDQKLSEQESLAATDLMSQLLYLQRLPLLLKTDDANKNNILLKKYGLLQVIESDAINLNSITSHCGLWVLLSLQINSLDNIELFDHCQTVTVSGIEQSQYECWQSNTLQPMKRIISAGQALAFSHVWDGVDLIQNLTS